jgi:integration host factor subunit beta
LNTVTKRNLAKTVAEAVSTKKITAQEAVDALFTAMREELIKGNRIEVRGFGVLDVREQRAKPSARNPRTGEVVYVPARRKTHFKPGKDLKEGLHKPLEQ